MKFINSPELNIPLGAGGNQNTSDIRAMVSTHPDYFAIDKDGKKIPTCFYGTTFEFDEQEKQNIRESIALKLGGSLTKDQLDKIMECMPKVWLNCMHGFYPVTLTVDCPTEWGHLPVIVAEQ